MTTNAFSPAPTYTISGIGPYDVPFDYGASTELQVSVVQNQVAVALDPSDYTVVPDGPATSGTVFLTAGAAATYDGETLEIARDTSVIQIWEGLASTAAGLEDQLDQLTRAIQDTQTDSARSLRVTGTWRTSVAELLADNLLDYTPGLLTTVDVGARITTLTEGFPYEVADSAATDHHVQTAGGVKLYVLPVNGEEYYLSAFGIAKDGVTDDYAKFRLAADACRDNNIANLILPPGPIYCSQEIEFDWYGGIFGAKGSAFNGTASTTTIYFPPGTNGVRFTRATTSTSGGSANDSIIRDLQIECLGDNTNNTGHGVVMDARGICVRVSVDGFPEDGFHIEATATANPSKNANLWTLERCRSNNNARDGFFVDGADVNAGEAIGCDANGNGRINFNDSSFLGNSYFSCHSSAPGRRSYGAGSDGKGYRCILDHVATVDTLPVTGANWATYWEEWNTTTSYPLIVAGTKYHESRAGLTGDYPVYHYVTDNANAKNVFVGCYAEGASGVAGGGSRIVYPSMVLSGELGKVEPLFGAHPIRPGQLPLTATSHDGSGDTVETDLGSGDGLLAALGFKHSQSSVTWRLQYNTTFKIWEFKGNNSAAARSFYICDAGNTLGKPAGFLDFSTLGFGILNKSHTAASAEPTSGTYDRGDMIYNTSPSAGAKAGWVCTTGGTAGSTAVFKPYGAIDA